MLVIDSIVLKGLNQRQQVVGFGNKDSIRLEQRKDAFNDVMNVFDMSKDIGCGKQFRRAMGFERALCCVAAEESVNRRNSPLDRELKGICWLDPANTMAGLKIAQ